MFECADSRFVKPRKFPKRERFYSFRLYEKNGEYPRGLRTSGLRGRFKALPEKILTEVSDGTSRNRFSHKTAAKKALNRCDAPALQREDLERTAKEWPYAFVDSKLWLRANLQRLWWKRGALGSDKERLVQKKSFWFIKG